MMRPSFARISLPSQIRGRGECRAPDAPDSRVCNDSEKAHTRSSGHTGITRHSPRNGFTAYNVLSRATGLSCHPRRRKLLFTDLTPASGRQDHTPSPSASAAPVKRAARVHRIPPPRFVTLRNAPPSGAGRRGYESDLRSGSRTISVNQKFDRKLNLLLTGGVGQMPPTP